LTQKNPFANPLTFIFLLKRRRFEFFKKKIDIADPVKTRNLDLGPGRPSSRVLKL
jgi:hypothetical protein